MITFGQTTVIKLRENPGHKIGPFKIKDCFTLTVRVHSLILTRRTNSFDEDQVFIFYLGFLIEE